MPPVVGENSLWSNGISVLLLSEEESRIRPAESQDEGVGGRRVREKRGNERRRIGSLLDPPSPRKGKGLYSGSPRSKGDHVIVFRGSFPLSS